MSGMVSEPVWSDLQLSWLQAMGHVVYLDRSAVVDAPAPAESPAAAPAGRRSDPPRSADGPRFADERASAPPPRRSAPPPATPEPVERAPRAGAEARRPRLGMPDRLQIALLRASGCDPNDPQTQALMASWPLERLRADPAAKRALWPQLRALRRKMPA
jgi:hypothetical protein